jgi:hypothetical protein
MTSWSAAAGLANPPNCFPEGVALEVSSLSQPGLIIGHYHELDAVSCSRAVGKKCR